MLRWRDQALLSSTEQNEDLHEISYNTKDQLNKLDA